ncbi:MAG: DoxX family membrane protein [bacterium]|nr:DoxX family membrane protein [Acidimicrobiia bacterium]MCY4650617.1 DoxX family membrane protein [bacterium]
MTSTAPRPTADKFLWAALRIMMGWIFLWPFLDKLFGLGFATEAGSGWVDGGSPTTGFLEFATRGPFAESFQSMTGAFADWLFMIGLLGIGLALLLGIGVRIASVSGALMLVLMWLAALWPEHNPFLDDHLIYAFVLIGTYVTDSGRYLGLGKQWSQLSMVSKYRFLV